MITPPPAVSEPVVPQALREWHLQSEHVLLLPYNDTTSSLLPEEFLAGIYYDLKRDGLLEITLPGMAPYTLNRFIHYFADKQMVVALKKPTYTEVAGFGWVYNAEGVQGTLKAFLGFGFLRGSHGQHLVREAARLALRWWFQHLGIDVLFGVTLASNMLASNFGRKLGFETVATVPNWFVVDGKFVDARLVTMTKAGFETVAAMTR